MSKLGFQTLFPIQELSVMGLVEIIPHVCNLLKRIKQVSKDIIRVNPDIIISIDSPSFSIRVAKNLKNLNIPKVHYIAPTVWAWRPWRVHKFKKYFDYLFTALPFEAPFFEKVGLETVFIGQPVME